MELELSILLRLLVASLLGAVIGFERERTGKDAGLRTHMLVSLGAAMFVSFDELFAIAARPLVPPGEPGNFRIQIEPLATVTAVVTAISFLGAGTIFVSGRQDRVKGLTTAASLWVTAAVGIATGIDRYVLAVGAALLALAILWLVQLPLRGAHDDDDDEGDEQAAEREGKAKRQSQGAA
jgi:putative Mg2+ transporter-C (MgtC) family protein